jgi:arginase
MERRYAIVEAPSTLGLRSTGVERLAETLLRNDLADRLLARRAGRVAPADRTGERDPTTLTLDAHAIASWSPRLADAVEQVLDDDEFPVILGGDCSILLGSALALKRRGRFGLLFLDGHADFYQPEVNPNGEAASMELAFATGHGPALLADIEGLGPLVRPDDAVVFGYRDADEQQRYGSQPLPAAMLALDLDTVRQMGVDAAMAMALERLTRSPLDGFFVHFDADVLDDGVMPAVDYRIPGGLGWGEARSALQLAVQSGRAVGLEVTIYNPTLDEGGAAGRGLTDILVGALRTQQASVT